MDDLISQYIEKNRSKIIENVVDLVKIPSISVKDEKDYPYGVKSAEAIDYCLNLCLEKGFITHNYEYYCAEAKINHSDGKKVLIASHVDVVDEDPECIYKPFGGEIIDNYIVGRGVVDDKAPLIATIYALNFFKEHDIKLNNEFILLFGANEENGMDDIDYYLKNQPQPDLAISADDDFPVVNGENSQIVFTISGKKSENVFKIESKKNLQRPIPFMCNVTINGIGKIKFCLENDRQNPILNMFNYFKRYGLSIFDDYNQQKILDKIIFNNSSLELKYKQDGKKFTIKPVFINTDGNTITVKFDIRHSFFIDSFDIINDIRKLLIDFGLIYKTEKINKGYYVDENDSIVKLLTDIYNKNTGTDCKPYTMSGCTYSRKFKNAIGFGAGNPFEKKPFKDGHGASHGPDEAHNIDVLMHALKIYILGIKALDDYYSSL